MNPALSTQLPTCEIAAGGRPPQGGAKAVALAVCACLKALFNFTMVPLRALACCLLLLAVSVSIARHALVDAGFHRLKPCSGPLDLNPHIFTGRLGMFSGHPGRRRVCTMPSLLSAPAFGTDAASRRV